MQLAESAQATLDGRLALPEFKPLQAQRLPGRRFGAEYRPSAFVVNSRMSLVAKFLMDTFALATADPDASDTTPESVAPANWAFVRVPNNEAISKKQQAATAIPKLLRQWFSLIVPPLDVKSEDILVTWNSDAGNPNSK